MANLSPESQFEETKKNVLAAVQEYFPIKGHKHELRLKDPVFRDNLSPDDVRRQKEARKHGQTWGIPLQATLELVDTETGKVVDSKQNAQILRLPKITREFTYIVRGQGRSVLNQFRLKSGVYTKRRQNGELASQFNLKEGLGFHLNLDSNGGHVELAYPTGGGSKKNVNLYPIMKAMGVTDDEIQRELGTDVYNVLRKRVSKKKPTQDLAKLYEAMHRKPAPKEPADMMSGIREVFGATSMYGDVTERTLGERHDKVSGRALLLAAKRMYQVARDEAEPDNLEDLGFKEIWSVEDHLPEKIRNSKKEILRRIRNNLDKKTDVRSVIDSGTFNLPVRAFFTQDSRSHLGDQTNPLTMIADHTQTTLMGSGGIGTIHQLTPENAIIDKTHMGFLDPMHTPESKKTGVVQHLPLGVVKRGRSLMTPVYNTKTNKMELIDPIKLHNPKNVIGNPDQYKWVNGKPVPLKKRVSGFKDGKRADFANGSVNYILPSPGAMMGAMSSVVPFANTNNGARVMMADRQIAQAISLKHREKPLVQSGVGIFSNDKDKTYEDIFGEFSSHVAPVSGKVVDVKKDVITIQDSNNKRYHVDLYDNYPLNDAKGGAHMQSEPRVKVGDTVKEGQHIADTNFTKDGVLAMGVNLRTAYMPSGGENFEDGVVISESAAKKMTSNHLYRFTVEVDADTTLDKKKFLTTFGQGIGKDQANKLGNDGVIRVGQTLDKGDTIMAVLRKAKVNAASEAMRKMKKVLFKPYDDKSSLWEKDVPGKVVDVVKKGRLVTVYVRAEEPMREGDKLTGRYGNKGIVVRIKPDSDMPRTKDGKHAEVLMSPTTVPTRINLGQVFETAVSKIGEKKGRYIAKPFHGETDRAADAIKEIHKHGVSATEELFDPKTGKSLGHIGFGPQYLLKLKHQVAKKASVRGRDAYDINNAPKRGGKSGAQKLDSYGTYSLLAHGAKDFLREKFTITSTRNDRIWEAIENGTPIPPPQTNFAWDKFQGFMGGLGVNLQKKGHNLKLVPFTDRQITEMSAGEIKKPHLMLYGDKEESGGLFDISVTGGINGNKWSHFNLAEPMPNPIFMKSIMALTGLSRKNFLDVSIGKKGFSESGDVVDAGSAKSIGGQALYDRLAKIDVSKELKSVDQLIKTTRNGDKRKKLIKKKKYLTALSAEGLDATAYMLRKIPVMPPKFRPIMATDDNSPFRSSLNGLYKYVGMTNEHLGVANKNRMTLPEDKVELRRALLGQIWKLYGAEARPYSDDRSIIPREDEETQGILELVAGKNPKSGYYQDKILAKRQDMSMRSVITVGSDLDIDEVGLPKTKALKLFAPLVKAELKKRGLQRVAQDLIDKGDKRAYAALQSVIRKEGPNGTEDFHPVVLKRDPALHKFSTMGYKVKLVEGDAIRLHPLSCEGFNADFDGDAMAAYVPVTPAAIEDVKRMLPSKNLFSATHGGIMHAPSQDAVWGLYEMSRWGKNTNQRFKDAGQALTALRNGSIGHTDVVRVGNINTTPGRLYLDSILPKDMRGGSHLSDPKYRMKKGEVKKLLNRVARNHKADYTNTVQGFLKAGNKHAYESGRTISLYDLVTERGVRDPILQRAHAEAGRIKSSSMSADAKDARIVDIYNKATDEILRKTKSKLSNSSNALFEMNDSGARGKDAQMRQMISAPMLVQNAKSETHPVPITRSYAEGLDFGSFWDTQHGARKGIVQRASGTAEPGAMSKKIVNTSISTLITNNDCGTKDGLLMKANQDDALGRVLAKDVTVGTTTFKAGEVFDERVRKALLKNQKDVPNLVLRSPLKCGQHDGLCSKCFGQNEEGKLHELGVNVGVRAGQAIGEPLSQGAMNAFHSGGVAKGAGAQSVSMFKRVEQLLEFPQTVRGATTLAQANGKVSSVKKNPTGGYSVVINGKEHRTQYQPTVKAGDSVSKGQPLSDGVQNPHEIMRVFGPKNGIKRVRQYINDELTNLFGARSSLHKRNVETVVRDLTDLVQVEDPGNAVDLAHGDYISGAAAEQRNKDNNENVKYNPVLVGANMLPLVKTEDFLARANYTKLKETFTSAANEGWKSDIHSENPLPALAWGKEFGKGTRNKPWLY